MCSYRRSKGAETKFALARCIDKSVDTQYAADAGLCHEGCIVNKVIGRNNVQLLGDGSVPFRYIAPQERVTGLDERYAAQILRRDALLCRERVSFFHEESPYFAIWQAQALIAGKVGRLDDETEVQ